jgi:signal peptidase II
MGSDARGGAVTTPAGRYFAGLYLVGPYTWLGAVAALIACVADQAAKLWLIISFNLATKGAVHLTPFLDLVLVRNKGISYGLFQQDGPFGQWALLVLKAVAVALLWIWLARSTSRLSAVGLGLIIGGAIGNAIDRIAYGAVLDFLLFTPRLGDFGFPYVFNLADSAIVAGVCGLLYESILGGGAAKAPRSEP